MYTTYETEEYTDWVNTQKPKSRFQIRERILRIQEYGHFGTHKFLDKHDVWELKFNDGRRIYYTFISEKNLILLLGGNKNGQDKDIKKAIKILRKLGE